MAGFQLTLPPENNHHQECWTTKGLAIAKAGEPEEVGDVNVARVRQMVKECDARRDEASQDSAQRNSYRHLNRITSRHTLTQV